MIKMRFFIIHVIYVLYSVAIFWGFRFCVEACLRAKGKSKTYIKKSKKGLRNYWFFEKVHREIGLGLGYQLNIALLSATLVYSVFVTALGWMPAFQVAAAILSVILASLQVPAILWGFIWDNRAEFGTFFVLFRRRAHARYFPFCDLLSALLPICFTVWNIFFIINSIGGMAA